MAEQGTLTAQQQKKLDGIVAGVAGLPMKDEKRAKDVARFANKWLRFKLGLRGTGPHSHGLNAEQRKALTSAIASGFGIKVASAAQKREASAAKKGKPPAATKKASAPKRAPATGKGPAPVAQLAAAQQARAEGAAA